MTRTNTDDDTETVASNSNISKDRRGFLGTAAALGLAGLAGRSRAGRTDGAAAGRGNDGPPWAPREHDHSGRNGGRNELGVAAPVESITTKRLSTAQQSSTLYVSAFESVSGSGTAEDPYTSPSGTAGMREAFERLNDIGGGVIYYPSGYYGDGTESWEIDLAEYENLRNNWAIYGDGLESSRIRCGSDDGNGIRIHDSAGTAMFYTELVGVRFEGECSGYTFVWGSEDLGDAYNSCWTRFATGNGDPAGTGACQMNFVLNSYHYGVHNAAGGVGVELRRVQFSGIEGSFSSGENSGDTAFRVEEFSFANHVRYPNIEATYDGIHIADSRAIYNVFQNAYFANIRGTAVVQDVEEDGPRFPAAAEQGTYFHNPFVAGAVERIVDLSGGTLYVDGSSKRWPEYTVQTFEGKRFGGNYHDTGFVGYEPRGSAPPHQVGRTTLTNGSSWDPDGDETAELVISNGESWVEIQDLGKAL